MMRGTVTEVWPAPHGVSLMIRTKTTDMRLEVHRSAASMIMKVFPAGLKGLTVEVGQDLLIVGPYIFPLAPAAPALPDTPVAWLALA